VPGIAVEIKFIVRSNPNRMQGADERLFPSFTASGENSTLLTGYIQAK